jgi:hypothetical protein
MKKKPAAPKLLNGQHNVTPDRITPEGQAPRLHGQTGTPIETYKGDPDATQTSDLDENRQSRL